MSSSDTQSTMRVQVGDTEIVISGNEKFVSDEIERWEDEISTLIREGDRGKRKAQPPNSPSRSEKMLASGNSGSDDLSASREGGEVKKHEDLSLNDFSYIFTFHEEGERLDLSCDLPGDSMKEKVSAATLLTLFGYDLCDIEEVKASELRRICEVLGAKDSNFAANYKSLSPRYIVVDDSESEQNPTLRLTRPGKERALHLASKLEDESQSEIEKDLFNQ